VDVGDEHHIAFMGKSTLRFHSVILAAGNSPGCLQLSRSRIYSSVSCWSLRTDRGHTKWIKHLKLKP
jgi:hypothetical protein